MVGAVNNVLEMAATFVSPESTAEHFPFITLNDKGHVLPSLWKARNGGDPIRGVLFCHCCILAWNGWERAARPGAARGV